MATEEMELLVKCIENSENTPLDCNDIVEKIKTREKNLLWVIESLESELISTELNKRLQGTETISKVLNLLPPEHLNEEEISHVTNFLCSKLKDHHNLIPPVLRGLLAIVQMRQLSANCIARIVDSLSTDVQNQLQAPQDRRVIYQILEALVRDHLPALQQLGTSFVYAVIRLVEAECNARNLELVFSILPRVLSHCTLAHLAQEFFDAIACYFPVEVPTVGAEVVGRETLACRLESCLTASSELATLSLDLLLEKLDSELAVAKMDSLSLLSRGCESGVWGAQELGGHWKELGYALHRELGAAAGRSVEIAGACLRAATALARALSASAVSKEQATLLQQFVTLVLDMSEHPLQQVEKQGFGASARLVCAVSRGSHAAARLVCCRAVPLLASQVQARGAEPHHVALLLGTITDLLATLPPSLQDLESLSCSALYFEAAGAGQADELQQQAFCGLACIVPALSGVERVALYNILESALLSPAVSSSAVSCLTQLAKAHPTELLQAPLFHSLFQHQDEKCELAVRSVCSLGTEEAFLCPVSTRLLALAVDPASSPAQRLHAVRGMQRLAELPGGCELLCGELGAVQSLLRFWLAQTQLEDPQALAETAALLSVLIRNREEQYQVALLRECWPLLGLQQSSCGDLVLSPNKALLSLGVVGSVRRTVPLPESSPSLLGGLVDSALSSEAPSAARDACGWLAACLVNKGASGEDLSPLLERVSGSVTSSSDPRPAVQLLLRLSRAVLLAGHAQLDAWMHKVIEILGRAEFGPLAAENLPLLLTEENTFLQTHNHANVKLLHRQRLVCYLPTLLAAYHREESSSPLLQALALLVRTVPRQALQPHLTEVVRALIMSLRGEDSAPAPLQASLGCLGPLLEETCPELAPHLSDLTSPCLRLAAGSPVMAVRIAALQCLASLTNYPEEALVPLKQDVLDGIQPCLDDSKRLVRRAAVHAAGRWHLLGSSGGS